MQQNDFHDLELSLLALGFSRGAGLTGFTSTLLSNVSTLTGTGTGGTNFNSVGSLTFNVGQVASATANTLNFNGGSNSSSTGQGGALTLLAGSNTSTTAGTGAGGICTISSGTGNVTAGSNSSGGAMNVNSGGGVGTGRAGDILIAAGLAATPALAGRTVIQDGYSLTNALVVGSSGATATIGFFQGAAFGGSTQAVGYGTPTGNVKTANFPGATATLLQTAQQLAQLMLDLKAYGLIGA